MGMNIGVLICNDHLYQIEKRPESFVHQLCHGINAHCCGTNTVFDFGEIFHMAHADCTGVYAIGGNCASRLAMNYNGGRHYEHEDKVKLLKSIAEVLGYSVVKKRAKP